MSLPLRGGFTTEDPRLDRIPQFDERSRRYAVRDHPDFEAVPRTKTWQLKLRLNQGTEGACTGFARSHDLAAAPAPAKDITDTTAFDLYARAKRLDEWPGEDYDGSSVLGACKAAVELGYIGEYRWAFGIDDVIGALSGVGGVVFGTDWLDSMFDPRPDGTLDTSGKVAGGHSFYGRGVLVPKQGVLRPGNWSGRIRATEPHIRITNSWGPEWGKGGEALISASALEQLLNAQGEAAVTTQAFAKPR